MSTPICVRCQKIYAAGSAPAKCVNCGGDVRIPGAAIKPATTNNAKPKTPSGNNPAPLSGRSVNRTCCRSGCNARATNSIKYFYEGKTIVMAPAPDAPERGTQDVCVDHARDFVAPATWTLVHKKTLPSFIDGPGNPGTASSGNNDSGCISNFLFMVMLFVFWAVVIIGGGWLVIEFFGWLFSDTGGGGGGSDNNMPFRMPRWRRR